MGLDIMTGLSAFGGGLVGYLVPFLFVLTIVVFFHELGHFLVARLCGIKVLTFSLGFGPELAGFYDRHGTRWKISAVPLGGYVKFFGDENAASKPDLAAAATMSESERKDSFIGQKVGPRAAVVAERPQAPVERLQLIQVDVPHVDAVAEQVARSVPPVVHHLALVQRRPHQAHPSASAARRPDTQPSSWKPQPW